ncbi:Hypothetical protein D9617_16g015030 [Elsinoe fawcettii]|nr:Hypothetical protein D9617_16g015030 [Elsinoe fawcettii]
MPIATTGVLRHHFPVSGMADLDVRQGAQRPITKFHQPMDKIGEFLSPAEAEFAYEGAEKENVTPSRLLKPGTPKIDSPLDVIDEERRLQPLVSPLHPSFAVQPAIKTPDIASGFQGTQLTSLNEHIQDVVPIFVELRTNVIVKDEFRLVTELSQLLARIYFCAQDGIMINVDHSACLMLASSFDPAYMLTITTTPNQLEYDINVTNTIEMQRLMHQVLSVPTHRGLVRFQSILEENVGMTGSTVAHLNHRTPRQLYDARQAISPGLENDEPGLANGFNPMAPPPSSANKVLRQQISSMSEGPERQMSIRSEVSSLHASDLSPRVDSFQIAHTSTSEHRRVQSDMALNFHRPRPVTTYSSRFREDNVDWRPTMPTPDPTPGTEEQRLSFFPSNTEASDGDDTASKESAMPPPPPIPQYRDREDSHSTKVSKRRSLFAVFKKG